jgi:hypothetical protein
MDCRGLVITPSSEAPSHSSIRVVRMELSEAIAVDEAKLAQTPVFARALPLPLPCAHTIIEVLIRRRDAPRAKDTVDTPTAAHNRQHAPNLFSSWAC